MEDNFLEDKGEVLFMVWVNMKFFGCRYLVKIEEIVGEFELKGGIFVLYKVLRKVKLLIENFIIYECEEGEEGNESNFVSVLNESV